MATILHTVQPGDTLWSIAQKHHTTVNDLARYNGIVKPFEIYPGQTLKIIVPDLPAPRWYVVQPGDSLFQIARYFNTSMEKIMQDNHLDNPNFLYPGQILQIK